jgi:hypothetical protein
LGAGGPTATLTLVNAALGSIFADAKRALAFACERAFHDNGDVHGTSPIANGRQQ